MGLIATVRNKVADRIEDDAHEANQRAKARYDNAPPGDAGAGQRIEALCDAADSLGRRDLADRIRR